MRFSRHDIALLGLRVGAFALLCFGHGVQKFATLANNPEVFPDPLHIGHVPALLSAMGAECVMSFAVAVGLYTRLCCLPICATMAIVALVVHRGDTWSNTEPSVLFLLIYSAIALMGPGRLSWDQRRR